MVGLGYVGLQLAAAFGRQVPTVGYDLDEKRIAELNDGYDRNGEVNDRDGMRAPYLEISGDPDALEKGNFIVVTVPTPVDRYKRRRISRTWNRPAGLSAPA